jgi:hypothetical protein
MLALARVEKPTQANVRIAHPIDGHIAANLSPTAHRNQGVCLDHCSDSFGLGMMVCAGFARNFDVICQPFYFIFEIPRRPQPLAEFGQPISAKEYESNDSNVL